ncbi:hypothetical protein F-E9_344 [Faustovirus]|nr:hypothetical protein F-VV57_0323 [Faustovirus]QJX73591.1 hypothetical protein F-VV63_0325 [Faustovirus]QJX74098.1 hypothetical protein F-E9_344 [Faustovirus]
MESVESATLPCEVELADTNAEYTRVVKEIEEYYGYDDDDIDDINATGGVNEVDRFKTMIKTIGDNDFQYVAIQCGYTTRLDGNLIAEFAPTVGAKLVGIGEYVGSGILHSKSGEPVAEYGEVLFKCNKVSAVFKLADHLMEYDHCGMFYWTTLYKVRTRDNIIVLEFDTESG